MNSCSSAFCIDAAITESAAPNARNRDYASSSAWGPPNFSPKLCPPRHVGPMRNAVHGHVGDARSDKVADALAEELSSGAEVGAAIAVDIDGESVLDIWAATLTRRTTIEWGEDTIINVWSSTKTVTSLAALMVADRGLLDLDATVATYWPEFAANGKQDVRVRHSAVAHPQASPAGRSRSRSRTSYGWDKSTSLLAAQARVVGAGTASGYRALQLRAPDRRLIRRTAGKSLKDSSSATEIAGPLEADFQIGARPEDSGRIAQLIAPPAVRHPVRPAARRQPDAGTLTNPAPDADVAPHRPSGVADADLGAVNGHGNARSLARMLSPVSLGGTKPMVWSCCRRRRSTGSSTCNLAQLDLVLGVLIRFGIGYGLPRRRPCRSCHPTRGSASGAVGVARWC